MIGTLVGGSALFLLCVPGLGWPIARRLPLRPLEQLGTAALLAVLAIHLWSGIVFVLNWPAPAFLVLPLTAAAGLARDWRGTRILWRDPAIRGALAGWVVLSAWCLGGAMFIIVHSGGTWAGDWWEHYQRARWFVEHGATDARFLGYELTARPPLANLVTGAFLGLTRVDYAHFQLFTVWLSTSVYLPAAMLAQRFGAPQFAPLTLACMLSPMVVQNATFPWTKLAAAFGILLGLYFYLEYRNTRQTLPLVLAAGAFAAGMLAHYSAGPYIAVMGALHVWQQRRQLRTAVGWRQAGAAAGAFAILFGPWLAWAVGTFGWRSTFMSNSAVSTGEATLAKVALNFWSTLIPHPLRDLPAALSQANPWVEARDWIFMVYQVNLPLALGSVGGAAVVMLLWRRRHSPDRGFWLPFLLGTISLGTMVHGMPDRWGLAHICLQPLVLTGLALLASNWSTLTAGWRAALIAGWTVDGALGLLLHFAAQNLALDRWHHPGGSIFDWMAGATDSTQMNFGLKFMSALDTLGDLRTQHAAVLIAFLAALLLLTCVQCRRPPVALAAAAARPGAIASPSVPSTA